MAGPDYRFVGVGPCGVPGGGDSMHMVFAPVGAEGAPISVFMQDATARNPQAMPRTLAQLGETAGGPFVPASRPGGGRLYGVSSSANDAARLARNLGE